VLSGALPSKERAAVETWMLVAAAAIVVLPFVLMVVFNAGDRADSRGRRVNHNWRVRRQET
jgi:hypothetical protein